MPSTGLSSLNVVSVRIPAGSHEEILAKGLGGHSWGPHRNVEVPGAWQWQEATASLPCLEGLGRGYLGTEGLVAGGSHQVGAVAVDRNKSHSWNQNEAKAKGGNAERMPQTFSPPAFRSAAGAQRPSATRTQRAREPLWCSPYCQPLKPRAGQRATVAGEREHG